ncbi:uncharacterized protein LOC123655779 isoform X2 [Melitaea cinxia]|uniref:uncharacterized protein LOC123655779 isoform X2 n=1 Tax=Melitaea cinxia TaxID=113334 RepID=UPI001E2708F6|nr:uncharacterized protein LOC123655779 isoform X2 [Melitaea cinxia]
MALTNIIVMAFIVASVNGGFVWQNDDNFAGNNFKFPKLPAFPPFPQLKFPTMPPMTILTPDDVAKKTGSNYNGVAVTSLSTSTVDEKGNVIRNTGGTIVTNTDGVVKKISYR